MAVTHLTGPPFAGRGRFWLVCAGIGRLAQGLERLVHTEEVTGSIPVSPTTTLGPGLRSPGPNAVPGCRALAGPLVESSAPHGALDEPRAARDRPALPKTSPREPRRSPGAVPAARRRRRLPRRAPPFCLYGGSGSKTRFQGTGRGSRPRPEGENPGQMAEPPSRGPRRRPIRRRPTWVRIGVPHPSGHPGSGTTGGTGGIGRYEWGPPPSSSGYAFFSGNSARTVNSAAVGT